MYIIKTNIVKQLWLFFLVLTGLNASTVTLKQLLEIADRNDALSKSLEQKTLSLDSKKLADTASSPLELYTEGGYAKPQFGNTGYEYVIGMSKNIQLSHIQEEEQIMRRFENEANLLEAQGMVINFRNRLKNLYHQYCIDMQNYRSYKQSYNDLLKLYKKKEKAYKYQEISKTELMQIEGEKYRLYGKLQEMKMMQKIGKEKLLTLSSVKSIQSSHLSCRDIYPIRTTIKLGDTFSLSKHAYKKRLASTRERMKRYSHTVESITVSAQYGKELGVDRYTLGVSLPLSFTSKRAEYEKAAAMYKQSALEYGYTQSMKEKKSMLNELRSRLKSHALMVRILLKNYHKYKNSVLPLIRKSYDLGETSVIEYLLNRQKLYTLSQEVYATKKAYYDTLFRLYTLSQKKD